MASSLPHPELSLISNYAAVDLTAMPSITGGTVRVQRVPPARRHGAESARLRPPRHGFRARTRHDRHLAAASLAADRRGYRQRRRRGRGQLRDGTARGGPARRHRAVGRSYITGWFADPASASEQREPADTSRIYTHEANYHPDGGQIFWPRAGAAFVALLAPPGDDVRPEDFVAFHCDGSFGIHIDPGVWHQPVFPLARSAEFDDRQGRVHACVAVDFVSEFGCYLEVPLALAHGATRAA